MRTNTIRFTGLASGLDTEAIVSAMAQPYKNKVDAQKQAQTMLEWKKDAWKNINNKILSFHRNFISNSRLTGTFNKKEITTSHPNMVSINEGSTLPEGSHTLRVKQLAEGVSLDTESIKGKLNKDKGKNTPLNELGITQDTTIKVNGGESITITSTDTVTDVEKKLKSAMKDSNVNFDANAGAFFISSKQTGANQTLSLEVTSGDTGALNKLGLEKVASGATPTGSVTKTGGKNAEVIYNGVLVESSSNQLSVNGLNVKLLAADENAEITLVSTQDKEAVVDFVKDFVEEYNKLIDEINTLTGAESTRDYKPLTDEQKEAMSDKEIEAWEKKIKDSLLRKDPRLEEFTSSMRSIIGSVVEGNEFKSLAGIGITTGNWKEKGKLYLDEDKLRKAIEQNSDAVVSLFTNKDTTKPEANGIGMQMYDQMEKMFKSSTDKSKDFLFYDKMLDREITSTKKQVSDLEAKYSKMETMYYKKFTALEKMMAQMNAQTSWLSQL